MFRPDRFAVLLVLLAMSVVFPAAGATLKVVDPLEPVYDAGSVENAPGGQVLRLAGPRNGFCSAQVVATGDGLGGLRAEVSALQGPTGPVPAEGVRVRYAGKEAGYDLKGTLRGFENGRFLDAYYDRLYDSPPGEAAGVLPIWVTVHVPAEAAPGIYRGTLSVGGNSVPVELTVGDWVCPAPEDWVTHVGTLASTDALAEHYNVPFWSEDHWRLIEKELALLGGIGSDDLWIYVCPEWQVEGLSTVRFTTVGDHLEPDFSVLDRYLGLYAGLVGRPQWVIVHAWNGQPPRSRMVVSTSQKGVVDGQVGDVPRANAIGGEELWKRVMDGIHQRVTGLGWGEETILIGLSKDQPPTQWTVDAFARIAPYARWASWSHGRGGLNLWAFEPDEPIRYASGQVLAYYVLPYTPSPSEWVRRPDRPVEWVVIQDAVQGGWNAVRANYASCRNDLHKYHLPAQYRGLPNGTMLTVDRERGGNAGFAFVWFDFWTRRFPNRWMQDGTRRNTGSIVEPGPDGPVATVRYEMLREGLQETEARAQIEKALMNGDVAGEFAATCRAFLQQTIDIRFQKKADAAGKDPYGFTGGHAGSTLGAPSHTWGFAPYPRWIELTGRLYDLAGQVQTLAAGREGE